MEGYEAVLISVVIPTYNESATIGTMLRNLQEMLVHGDEVVVVDGLSEDETQKIVKTFHYVKLITSKRGRGVQMNTGAQEAKNGYILFLHADNVLNRNCLDALREKIRSKEVGWGWFPIRLNSDKLVFKVLEAGANLRLKLTGTPLGDHGIFVRKDIFNRVGGFPEIPLMEDLELVKRVKKVTKGVEINCPIGTSVRRFEKSGILRTFTIMWALRVLYYSGMSAEKLARYYKQVR